MNLPLSGQTILVTGASRGIGAAIVYALSSNGAQVIIHYGHDQATAQKLLQEIDGKGWIIQADLSTPEGAFVLWKKALDVAGRIHALVNNAGIRTEVLVQSDPETWQKVWQKEFQVNFFAAADLSKQAILHFQQQGGGRIINMASRAGQRGYSADALPYGCSKAALINLTKSIARSFAATGITAMAIAPGWVHTEMAEFMVTDQQNAALAEIPTGEMAAPEEVADLVTFLLRSSQKSLNGATIDINGGSYIR